MSDTAAPAMKPRYKSVDEYLEKNPSALRWARPPVINGPKDYIPAVLATELVPGYQQSQILEAPHLAVGRKQQVLAEPWHFRFNHGWAGLVSEQNELFEPLLVAI